MLVSIYYGKRLTGVMAIFLDLSSSDIIGGLWIIQPVSTRESREYVKNRVGRVNKMLKYIVGLYD